MKRNIKTLGVVVLVGSLVLSVTVVFEPVTVDTRKEQIVYKKSVKDKIIASLADKGIEHSSMDDILSVEHNLLDSSVSMLSRVLNVEESKVIEKISDKILHKNSVDLKSADTLISLAQSISGIYLNGETIDAIHQYVNG